MTLEFEQTLSPDYDAQQPISHCGLTPDVVGQGRKISDISVEARASRYLRASKTPNCVECSRSVGHSVCTTLHFLDGGWVIEHGPRREELELQGVRTDLGKT